MISSRICKLLPSGSGKRQKRNRGRLSGQPHLRDFIGVGVIWQKIVIEVARMMEKSLAKEVYVNQNSIGGAVAPMMKKTAIKEA